MNLQSGCNTGQGTQHSTHKPNIRLQTPPSDHRDPASNTTIITGACDTHSFTIRLIFTALSVHQKAGLKSQDLREQMDPAWSHQMEVAMAALPVDLTIENH